MATSILFLCLVYISSAIGGSSTVIDDFPFQVSIKIQATNIHVCGGAVITEKFVVTAAHCVCGIVIPITEHYIFLGSTKLSGKGQIYNIEQATCHPDYDVIKKINDIALIGVKNTIKFNNLVKPTKLLTNELPVGSKLLVTGWGNVSYPNVVQPDTLQKLQVPIISMERCRAKFPTVEEEILGEKVFCTFVEGSKASTCKGDSGGPVTLNGVLVGLISWDKPCMTGKPNMNTKISSFVRWIQKTIVTYCKNNTCPINKYPKYVVLKRTRKRKYPKGVSMQGKSKLTKRSFGRGRVRSARSSSEEQPTEHLIGGTDTVISNFPYQVSIKLNSTMKHVCGGAIITEKFVLTAAHCVCFIPYPITEHYIFVGSSTLSGKGVIYSIEDGVCHASYNTKHKLNDIALIGINSKFTFNKFTQAIKITKTELPVGTNLMVSGWGYISYPNLRQPDKLQKLSVPIISIEACKAAFRSFKDVYLGNTQICTFVKNRKAATCKGDSGGPVTLHGVLVGLVSWGVPCAQGKPDSNTKVSKFIYWIKTTIDWYCKTKKCPTRKYPKVVGLQKISKGRSPTDG